MARTRKSVNIDGSVYPARMPGRVNVVFDSKRNRYIMRAWPKGNGGDTPARAQARATFTEVCAMIKRAASLDYAAAVRATAGTKFLPRDFLMKAAYGVLIECTTSDGITWKGRRVLQSEIQSLLASLGNIPGMMLVNDGAQWVCLLPGNDGDILKYNAAVNLPTWQPDSGGGGSGAMHLIGSYTADVSTNTNIDFGLTGGYEHYRVVVRGKIGGTSGAVFMRVSDNGGSTFYAGASDYKDVRGGAESAMLLHANATPGNARPFLSSCDFCVNAANGGFIISGTAWGVTSSGTTINGAFGGSRNGSEGTINALRIAASATGNAANLTADLYGIDV